MNGKTLKEFTIEEYNRKKREETIRRENESEKDREERETNSNFGINCPHTITDENLGIIFCIRCGIVTEEQTFNQGGGWYGNWRSNIVPRRRPEKRKTPKKEKKK